MIIVYTARILNYAHKIAVFNLFRLIVRISIVVNEPWLS